MTSLPTSVHFDISFLVASKYIYYQLEFFPGEEYKRTYTLRSPKDNFYESALRFGSGVPDINVTVTRYQEDGPYPTELPNPEMLMGMTFDNPRIGTPEFTYNPNNRGKEVKYTFKEFEKKVVTIQDNPVSFFPFNISVERLKDGYPEGGDMRDQMCKNWRVVFEPEA